MQAKDHMGFGIVKGEIPKILVRLAITVQHKFSDKLILKFMDIIETQQKAKGR